MKMTIYHKNTIIVLFAILPSLSVAQWTEVPMPLGPSVYNDLTQHKQAIYTTYYKNFQIRLARTTDLIHWELAAIIPSNLQNINNPHSFSDGERLFVTGRNNLSQIILASTSSDDGQSWTTLNWPNQTQTDLFEAWNSTFLAINDSVVQRSGNSGGAWQTVFQTQGKVYDLKRIGDQTWIMTTKSLLYRSTDDGITWHTLNTPYNASNFNAPRLTIYPTELGAFIQVFNANQSTLFRSLDLAESWTVLPLPIQSIFSVTDILTLNEKIFIAAAGLWSSDDEGTNWVPISNPGGWTLEKVGNSLCLGSFDGFFKSHTEGQTWLTGNWGLGLAVGVDLLPNFYLKSTKYHQGKLYFLSKNDCYITENQGLEWSPLLGNIGSPFSQFFANGDTIIMLGSGATRSFDNGNTWENIPANGNSNHPLSGGFDFTATKTGLFASSWFVDSIYHSADWGLTWSSIALAQNLFSVDYLAGVDNVLYMAASDGAYISYNNGQSFTLINNGLGNNPYVEGLWSAENIPFLLAEDQFFRRHNNLWKPATPGLYDDEGNLPYIVEIKGDAGRLLLCGYSVSGSNPLLFLSEDNGQSWSGGWELGLPPIDFQFSATLHGTTIYACGELASFSSAIGIWKRELTLGSHESDADPSFAFSIHPNPVSDLATLTFKEETDTLSDILIIDTQGTLKWQGKASRESMQIAVSNWPNGLYELKVQYKNGKFETRKMLVIH